MGEQHSKKCRRCNMNFNWSDEEAWFDYKGYTPTKLVKCKFCGTIQAVKYESEQNVNFDPRYYEYK